jgi:hypothetical protein
LNRELNLRVASTGAYEYVAALFWYDWSTGGGSFQQQR